MIEPQSQSFNLADNLEKQIAARNRQRYRPSRPFTAHHVPVLPDAFAAR
jgi:hypothetical protein